MLQPGDSIGGCRILLECGRGAFGRVFLAEDALGRRVAIKQMLSPEAGEYELKGLRNFIRLRAGRPGLMTILHCGTEHGLPFYVMEAADNAAVDGYEPDTLALRLKRSRRLPAAEALSICHTLLKGLEALHQAGLLHRDIKPENVIFVQGKPCLADPGLTRNFEQTISIVGTPGYLAPELLRGHVVPSPTLDIYAFGKLLYHIFTGEAPENFPELPGNLPVEELYQICHPLLKLCAESPQDRLQNCADCRAVLPREIKHHGPLLRFRDAIFARPALRRRLASGLGAMLLAMVILVLGVAGGLSVRARRQRALSLCLAEAQSQVEEFKDHLVPLNLQLEDLGEEKIKVLPELESSLAAGHPEAVTSRLALLQTALADAAHRHLPSQDEDKDDFDTCARGFGYLASPLGSRYLDNGTREELRQSLEQEAIRLAGSSGIQLGSEASLRATYMFQFAFVAPGLFWSPTTQSVRRISYPYWIFDREISHAQYEGLTGLAPKRTSPWQAVEYLCWNEALEFCRKLTEKSRMYKQFPTGYVVRPPTEEEWEFAALGGWQGIVPAPREIPKGTHNAQPGQGQRNALGIFNIDDNLSEIVEPYSEIPPRHQADEVVVRGEKYKSKMTGLALRDNYILSQYFCDGAGGLRPVLAPADDDYFSRSWYRGPDLKPTRIGGAIYVSWSLGLAGTTWAGAAMLAKDVGAALPENISHAQLRELLPQVAIIPGFPIPLGIRHEDDGWHRLSDQAIVDLPQVQATSELDCLNSTIKTFGLCRRNTGLPSVLLCWQNEKSFADRLEHWLQQGTLTTVELDGHVFRVCRGNLPSFVVRPFVKFMGARQPVLSDPEQVKRLAEKLPSDLRIALGPIYFYGKWELPDGSVTSYPGLTIDETNKRPGFLAPLPLQILGTYHGKSTILHTVDAVLLEM